MKNLGVYTASVVGPWASDDPHDHGKLAAELALPGGNIGDLAFRRGGLNFCS